MAIDFLFMALLVFALYKGYTRGLVRSVFSVINILLALLFATKLSAIVATKLHNATMTITKSLPFISFLLVMIATLIVMRIVTTIIQKGITWALLRWVDKLGGIVLHVLVYMLVFSIILFYAVHLHFVAPNTVKDSMCYGYVQNWGQKFVDGHIGQLIHIGGNVFNCLNDFFRRSM